MLLYDNITKTVTRGGVNVLYDANLDYNICEFMIYLNDLFSINIQHNQAIFSQYTTTINCVELPIIGSDFYELLKILFYAEEYEEIIFEVKNFMTPYLEVKDLNLSL